MSGSLNKVILIGNLGLDPEVRTAQDGSKMVTISLATSENWKDKMTGERKDRTEWHRVIIFNERLSEVAERYLKKGSKIYVEGQLQTRKWTDNNGQERYSTEVILGKFRGELTMLDGRSGGASDGSGGMMEGGDDFAPLGGSSGKASAPFDDDVPF